MKTIYSLREFHQKAVEVSGRKADHVLVVVELGLFDTVKFTCYADGLSHCHGKTMQESLDKLYELANPRAIVDNEIDVEIEVAVEEALDKFPETLQNPTD